MAPQPVNGHAPPARKPYAKPAVKSQRVFESTALQCTKFYIAGQGEQCFASTVS